MPHAPPPLKPRTREYATAASIIARPSMMLTQLQATRTKPEQMIEWPHHAVVAG